MPHSTVTTKGHRWAAWCEAAFDESTLPFPGSKFVVPYWNTKLESEVAVNGGCSFNA
jgi:hypothetical protein